MTTSQFNLRTSGGKYICCGLGKEEKTEEIEKPQNLDLISWLKSLNVTNLRKNFQHNGFDSIEYLILQCFSVYSVNDEILENYMHIYEKNDRRKILYQLSKDINIINKRLFNRNMNLNNFELMTEFEQEKIEPGCNGCMIF